MATNRDLRPPTAPAPAGWLALRAGLALVAGVAAVAFVAGSALLERGAERPAFLADKLGSSVATAPRHETASGGRVELPRSGYALRTQAGRVAIASADESGARWRSFENGSVRTTPFGEETVVVDGEVVEQFLTVTERTGPKRWRWRLETGTLEPTSRPDGSVLVTRGNLVTGFKILPAAILDADGDDVTPPGTRWQLERRNGGWWLALDLDDRDLPLPYVIDPATMTLRAGQGANNGAGATTLVIGAPAGLAVDDQLVAQVTARGGTGTFICAPAGWTSVRRTNSGTTLAQEIFRKTADAADVAAANFAFTLDNTSGCGSPTALKASGGIVAVYGVDNSSPISANNGQANASSSNVAAPTITPAANEIVLGFFGTARAATFTAPTGSPTFTEEWDQQSSGGSAASRTASELATALSPGGATGTKTAVASAAAVNIGQLVSLRLDTTDPATPSLVLTESDADTYVSGTTLYYRAAGNGGTFDIDATTSDGQSGLKHVSFPGLTGGFTPTSATNDATPPYANTYSWTGGATDSGAKTVTAEDNATNQATSTFTVTPDDAVPTTGALTVNGTAASPGGTTSTSSGSFSISRTDYTDGGSGLASSTLTRDSATFTNDSCGSYSGSPTTIVGAPAQSLGVGCYRYVLTGIDNVGNTVSIQTDVQVHGAATRIALSGSTADLASGATRVLTATVQDAAGNTVTSDSTTVVTFAKASGAGSVSGTGTATASSGVATKTITGVLVGSVTMEATASGLTTGTLGAFTVVHGPATQIALAGSTADLTSGATRVLTATIQDAAGNTVTSDSSTSVTFTKASGAGTVTGTGAATASSGVATKTVTGQLAGSVTMEATASGLTTGSLGAFTVVHGPAAQITLTGSTADLTSGTSRVLTATLRDAAGNVATSDSSTVVTFAKASGTGSVGGTGTATASSGVATKTITGQLVGSVTMEATAGGLTTGTLGAFTVVHGAATQIALSGSTADLTSGATRVLTATIQDAAGNAVTSDSSTVVTFNKASGAGTVTGTGSATAASGVATKTITGALVGSVAMEATAGGLTTGTLAAFTVVHGPATQIALSGSTANLTSGATRVLTATVQDTAGNTVTSDSSTVVTFNKASGAGTVTGTGSATASSGVATKTITGQLAGSVTMEATASGLTTGSLGAFTIVHGPATQIALSGSTADLTSGTNRVLTATIQDAAGNTVTSDSSTVITFAKASGAGTVTGTGATTASSGAATKTITGTLAGPVTMEATASGLSTGTLGAFTIVHGAATQIDLTHSGSTASGDNHTLTATLRDAAGNVATGDSSTVVAFAKTGGPGTVTGLGSAAASNGVATKVVVNAASGQIDLDAQAAGLTTGTTSYVVSAGSASTATSTIAASPTSIVANGSSTSAITVRLKDAAGNDLTGSGGVVALSLTGAGSLSAVTDNGDGTYSATLTSPTTVGSATVTGTLNAAALAASAGVTYTHGPATRIALGESGSTVAGNPHALTATIQDANGNTVTSDSSTVVAFAKTGGAGTVTGLGSATASSGVATRNVTNMLAGQIDLDAQASGLTAGTASYTITVGPVSPAASDSTVVAAPATVYANGLDTATVTVTLRDVGGNPIAGKTVTLAQGGGSSTISGGGSSNASGVVTFSVADSTVETVTYTATDTTDSITLADDAVVDFTFQDSTPPTNTVTLASATRARLSGTTLYYNGAAGGSFTLRSTVVDGGSGPASAEYPALARPGWTHGAETVSTPAGGPYDSGTFTFAAGSSGDFAYTVTAADSWAPPNTTVTTLDVREDSTAPAASILCGGAACSAGWYTSSPVSVTLAAPDAGAGLDQIRYTTDGSDPTILAGTVYAAPFDVAAEGVTTVKYRAFDRVGNDTGVLTQTIRLDTVAPSTVLDSTPNAATQDTTPTFAFSSPDGGVSFQTRVNGGSWSTETSPLTLGPLVESTYTFEVRAVDAAGNQDATPASFTFTVDTTAADTTITAAPPAASSSAGATFSFTASDAGPGFECRLDGGAWADCTSPKSYAGLSEAAHSFEVRAEDAAGNLDASPASHAWTVDLTEPDTSFLSTPADPSASTTPTFGLGSSESPPSFECKLDGGGWSPCATPFTTAALGDGSHTLQARASDAAGNQDASAVSYTWLVDATAPTGSVTSPADGAAVAGTVALASSSADPGGSGVATVVFQRSPATAGTWTSQAASWDTTLVADGDYDLRVVTTDAAGNSFTSPVVTVTVDNTEPVLSVVAPNPVNLATADPATITATATDDGTGVANVRFDQCAEDSPACVSDSWVLLAVDTGAPYAASWPIPSDGPRLLRVRATDEAGKQRTELVLVTVDRIRPAGTLTAPAAASNLRGSSVALTATASDTAPGTVNTVTFQLSPAGAGTWTDVAVDSTAPYTGTLDTTAVADGLYDLRVFTTDAAGNAEAAPASIQVRVDNTLPTGSVTSPAGGANLRGTVTLASDSADAGSGVATVQFQRSPAGAGTWTTEAASFDTTAVADGLYDLRVVTTDNAGNTRTSAAIEARVDNTLPTGSLTAPANGAEIGVAPVSLTSDSADAGSGVAAVVFERSPAGAGTWTATAASWDTASGPDAVADGLYDLRVKTTDNAGNSFTSAAITVLVDHTAPTTTASLAPGSPSNAPVTVSFSAGDGAGSGVSVTSYRVDGGSLQTGAAVVIPAPGDGSNDGAHVVEFFSTDEVGNVETLKSTTVVIDTTAPSGSGGDPGDYLRGLATLTYSTSATDVSSVQFQFSPEGAGAWTSIGAADLTPPYEATWNTTLVADGPYDLRAVVTDTTGNVANTLLPGLPKTVDNTAPSGSVSAPAAGAFVSGSIPVDASATDGAVPPASGVSAVRFEVKPAGAGAFTVFGTQVAPIVGSTYRQTLDTTGLADGPAELRVVVTDVAGNETTSATRTVSVDNDAPVVTLGDPGAAVGSSASLTASSSADTTQVAFRYRAVGSGGPGTLIDTDTSAPFGVTWPTPPAAETQWELIAVATDGGGNTGTSAPRTVLVDRTQPTGSVTAPASGATVGGPSVALAASADDAGGSGVTRVEWFVKPFGSGTFSAVADDATAPYTGTWNSTSAPDGAAEIRAEITDAAGNVRTTPVASVTVDSTGPSVTLNDPGAVVSGTVALTATTGGGATRVQFAVSPADAGAWTQIAEDATPPYGADFDTGALADGLYDLRAIGYDALGNPSTPSVREDVRLDNTAPALVSSAPADGSAPASANAIVLTASEPVTAPGTTLDGSPAPAPAIAGNELTFATGALADGLHVLAGELEDPSGTRVPFRVSFTVVSSPTADPPPVERNVTSSGDWTLTVPGGLVTVRMPQGAWPTPPTPQDYILVLRVDAGPAGAGFAPGTQVADVTARWALAGTPVTEFKAPIEIIFANPTGGPTVPGHSPDATTWSTIPPLGGPLPAQQRDGFSRSGTDVHVWTRHLTYFGLMLDGGAPTAPTGVAGVVASDGLTIRWIPGTDASGQLGNVILRVNGEDYREFGPTELEAKLGPFTEGDTRTFMLVQKDAAGNASAPSAALRAVPPVAGRSLADARALLGAAGFAPGSVREVASATAIPGTVLEPAQPLLALLSTQIDLVVARGTVAPQTQLAFSVAAAKRLPIARPGSPMAVRLNLTKPAGVVATLRDAKKRQLRMWKLKGKAGANVVRLRLPRTLRPGTYTITLVARAGAETVSRTVRIRFVTPKSTRRTRRTEVVLAGDVTAGGAIRPGRNGLPRRVLSVAGANEAFDLVAAGDRDRSVVVLDTDAFGTRVIRDLRAVFPSVRVIALSREPATRSLAHRAGAVRALPRNTPTSRLVKAIAAAAAS